MEDKLYIKILWKEKDYRAKTFVNFLNRKFLIHLTNSLLLNGSPQRAVKLNGVVKIIIFLN